MRCTATLSLVFGVGTDLIRELWVAAPYLKPIGTRSYSPTALREQLANRPVILLVVGDPRRVDVARSSAPER